MQKLVNASCSFVLIKYSTGSDVANPKWMSTEERLIYATQLVFTFSKLTIETLEQIVKYVQS